MCLATAKGPDNLLQLCVLGLPLITLFGQGVDLVVEAGQSARLTFTRPPGYWRKKKTTLAREHPRKGSGKRERRTSKSVLPPLELNGAQQLIGQIIRVQHGSIVSVANRRRHRGTVPTRRRLLRLLVRRWELVGDGGRSTLTRSSRRNDVVLGQRRSVESDGLDLGVASSRELVLGRNDAVGRGGRGLGDGTLTGGNWSDGTRGNGRRSRSDEGLDVRVETHHLGTDGSEGRRRGQRGGRNSGGAHQIDRIPSGRHRSGRGRNVVEQARVLFVTEFWRSQSRIERIGSSKRSTQQRTRKVVRQVERSSGEGSWRQAERRFEESILLTKGEGVAIGGGDAAVAAVHGEEGSGWEDRSRVVREGEVQEGREVGSGFVACERRRSETC